MGWMDQNKTGKNKEWPTLASEGLSAGATSMFPFKGKAGVCGESTAEQKKSDE